MSDELKLLEWHKDFLSFMYGDHGPNNHAVWVHPMN